jgi:guanidinobutyrase
LPILRAIHKQFGPVAFIQLDAHGDTWGGYFGSPHSHGTPVKYAVEEGLIAKGYALQVGLRGQVYSDGDFDFARKHGIQIITSEEFHRQGTAPVKRWLKKLGKRPLYVTLDIDVVDPAFAPGTGTPQVGGLSSAQILDLVRCLKGLNLVGCDLVEVSPPYDNGEITSLLAANLLFELLCLF